jgi:FAD/FMN-containing dehydrogenase/Fe-S oxidoreductase
MSTAEDVRASRTHTVRVQIQIPPRRFEDELRSVVRGEVRFSEGDRGMYASDAGNYRMVPLGVVVPRDADDVIAATAVCRRRAVPVFARGGGTGIPGQTVNNGLLFDFSKYMDRIVDIDAGRRIARVQPGVVLDTLRSAAKPFGLTFGPDPATHNRCTLGGMIGNNSCGIHSVMAGRTSENVEALEILTYDGTRMWVGPTGDDEYARIIAEGGHRAEIFRRLKQLEQKYGDAVRRAFPKIPRRVSGYNLPALLPENGFNVARALVGSECTCVLVLEAALTLVPDPPVRSLLVLGYDDIFAAADHVTEPLPFNPIGLEALDDTIIDAMKKKGLHAPTGDVLPDGHAWLLVEFGGKDKADADRQARALMDHLKPRGDAPSMKLFDDAEHERLVWHVREEGLGASARVPGEKENHEGWEDTAVAPEKLGGYLRDLRKLLDKYGYDGPLYGHFGQGCVHTRLTFDLKTAPGIAAFRNFLNEGAELVARYDGSLSGEHGDGQARGELLARMFPPEIMEAFREFKTIWDPEWKMNPGKLIDPYRVDEHLRLGPHFNLTAPATYFAYPDDHFSFAEATERCVGAGVCRRHESGTMCPSYMVTREEKHSTRGRARLLNEMLRGNPVTGGWHSDDVKEALDLCLSCKGCKHECPVQVDMATYKAEFLAHYFEGRLRPRTAYTMGRIHDWARIARFAPAVANVLTHAPILRGLAKTIAGVHQRRTIPAFAGQTFEQWFRARARRSDSTAPPVILWADTFNNHFHPHVGQSAVRVLERLGFAVQVPSAALCCGRPLFDWGMLDSARHLLQETLSTLRDPIERGVPVVVLEPSCASVFRDELVALFPQNEDAKRLASQTVLFGEFIQKRAAGADLPRLDGRALLHGHCHHKSLMNLKDEVEVLRRLGLEVDTPDTGCCGMAGAFGFEREKYDIAMQIGERVLLPAVREARKDTLIVSDGFSCHEQIAQATDRQPLHVAEVVDMAMTQAERPVRGEYPERAYVPPHARDVPMSAAAATAVGAVALGVAGIAAWRLVCSARL